MSIGFNFKGRNGDCMFLSTFINVILVSLFLPLLFCNETGTLQPDGVQYGTISGRVLYPDTNLFIRMISADGADTATRNPESQMFTFNHIRFGNCILQVKADGYGLFEEKFVLEQPQFICHDIVLAQTPPQVAYLFPSNSQNLDSVFFSLYHSSITDSGFQVVITFNDIMDSASVFEALTVSPDTVGVQTELVLLRSLIVHFPYWKLAAVDTVKVSISTKAINKWKDTLGCTYTVFYPVDTSFIRTTRLE